MSVLKQIYKTFLAGLGTVLPTFEPQSEQRGWSYLIIIDKMAVVHASHIFHQKVQSGSSFPCYVQSDHIASVKDSLGDLGGQCQRRIT